MVVILSILTLIFIYMFLKSIYKVFKLVPSSKAMTKVLNIKKLGRDEKDILDKFMDYSEKLVIKVIKYKMEDSEKIEELKAKLLRADSKDTPERHIAKQYIYPILSIIIGFIIGAIFKDIKALSYLIKGFSVFFAVLLCFFPGRDLAEKLNYKNDKIIMEMPRFIRTLRFSPQEKTLNQIVKDYLSGSKSGLRYDLTLLNADLELFEESEALNKFADRVGIPEVRELITIIQTGSKNSNADINLMFMESKFTEKVNRLIDKELKKRPEILDSINDATMYALLLIFIVPMLIHTLKGFQSLINN